jgi:hypothetical protein
LHISLAEAVGELIVPPRLMIDIVEARLSDDNSQKERYPIVGSRGYWKQIVATEAKLEAALPPEYKHLGLLTAFQGGKLTFSQIERILEKRALALQRKRLNRASLESWSPSLASSPGPAQPPLPSPAGHSYCR